jgi:hypothetical protein
MQANVTPAIVMNPNSKMGMTACQRIALACSADSQWLLEVVDERGTSTVWDDLFETDKQALEEAFTAIESEGIGSFIS